MATRGADALYLHLFKPAEGGVKMELPRKPKIKSVVSLRDGSALAYSFKDGILNVSVPFSEADSDYVVKITFRQ